MTNPDLLKSALKVHEQIARELIGLAAKQFCTSLGESRCPSSGELESAMNAACRAARERLFQRDMIEKLSEGGFFGGKLPSDGRVEAMRLSVDTCVRQVHAPPLPKYSYLPGNRLALAAALGATIGVFAGSPIGIYLLGSRDTGLVLGAPLGALLVTWAVQNAARLPWLNRALKAALGAASVAEVWGMFTVNPVMHIWRRLSGDSAMSRIKRVAVYLLLIIILAFAKEQLTFDRAILAESARRILDQWLFETLVVLAVLGDDEHQDTGAGKGDAKAIAELGRRLAELHSASPETLSVTVEDLIRAAREAGFGGLDGPTGVRQDGDGQGDSLMQWNESLRERYIVFGHVEAGDTVHVEQEPVVFRGEIKEKGLVRKQRGR